MHSTGSTLLTMVERIRGYLDLTTTKFDDDYIVRNIIMPEMVNVWSRVSLTTANPILLRFSITLEVDKMYYQLPPNVGEVWEVVMINEDGRVVREWTPRDQRHPAGPGWALEGNVFKIQPHVVGTTGPWIFHYMPNGDFLAHYAKGGYVGSDLSSSSSSSSSGESKEKFKFTLSGSAPVVGQVDRRDEAYAGAILRVLQTTGGGTTIIEERIIDSYDAETRVCTLRTPLTRYVDGDECDYEVTVPGMQAMVHAIAARAAMNLGVHNNISQKLMAFLTVEYRMALKTISDNITHMNQRMPKRYERDTRYNPEDRIWFLV